MKKLVLLASSTMLIACALAAEAQAEPEQQELLRSDGSTINYMVDHPENAPGNRLIVLAQGSGCLPASSSETLATVRAAFPSDTTLIVEKYGILPDAQVVDENDCPSAFHENYTLSQRLSDYLLVLEHLKSDPEIPEELILIGGSEGGWLVTMLAPKLSPSSTIIVSAATGMRYEEVLLALAPPDKRADLEAGVATVRADPDSSTLFYGNSHRMWVEALDVFPLEDMRESSTAFLLVQGGQDHLAPAEVARMTVSAFANEARCNLTYWEFPTLGHGLVDATGQSHLYAVALSIATWTQNPLPAC